MHHIPSVEPIPLQESISDYSFSGLSDFLLGNNNKRSNKSMERYPEGYGVYYGPMPPMERIVPHENDILMGRGGKNNQHTGNEKLRQLARIEAKEYSCTTKKGKSIIAKGLVTKVRTMNPPGRFLKRNPISSMWEDVGDEYAREKTSQVLRDAVALLPEDRTATEKDEIPGLRPEQSAVVETLSSKHERRPKRAERTKQPRRRPYESDCSGLSKDCPPMPPLKRQRTNPCNFFERYAFYPAFGRSDSTCLLDKFSAPTPYLFRQESMDMSRRKVSLDNLPRSVAPLLSDDEEDEEPSGKYFEDDFLTDFF